MAKKDEAEESDLIKEMRLEGMLNDAETFVRTAWDVLDDLAAAGKVPRALVDKMEAIHDELVNLIPDDDEDDS